MSTFQIISPSTGEVIHERNYHTDQSIQKAAEVASKAQKYWKNVSIHERAKLCKKAVQYFKKHADAWGEELTHMMGRPIRYTANEILGGFVERANYMIDIAEESLADISATEKTGFLRYIKREALGTVLVLAPWNYPYLTSVNAIIPALMAGNAVILKHAEQTALCAERYAEAFDHAGLPPGVFQFLHMNHEQVAALIGDPNIDHVAFTGSVAGGHAVHQQVANRFISAGLELGGKDPAYVREDADLPMAIENLVDGSFFNSGQSCCGVERIYVHKSVFDAFVVGFVALTRQYKLGDPLDPETTIGPMVRVHNAQMAEQQIAEAIKAGATPLIQTSDFPSMSLPFLAPQVLINVNHTMSLMTEESFAPIVGIMAVQDDDEAIRLMNDSVYGLSASIWTKDPEKAIAIGNQVETGTWYMNRCDYLDPELAWTGVKNSGKGCTLSSIGYETLTRPKSFHLKLK
jgi:acyl-CoA reductase-like NAD-dependent aldehyde dehydrogenase